ncbi:MAG: hypothetical protein CW346_13040 [Bacillaceae bacterium]|nr:hypothetical protein [Bacillaceae bacterium]
MIKHFLLSVMKKLRHFIRNLMEKKPAADLLIDARNSITVFRRNFKGRRLATGCGPCGAFKGRTGGRDRYLGRLI